MRKKKKKLTCGSRDICLLDLYPIIQELGMVTVGGGDTGDCCQLVDGADTIRISWSGEHDDDNHVQVVLMSLRIRPVTSLSMKTHDLLRGVC